MEKGVGVAVCVEHGYIPTSPDELPLAVGERVVVLARSGTWLLGHAEAALPATAAWFPMVNVAPPPPPVHLHGYQHRRVKATSSARDAVGTGDVINLLPSDFSRVLAGKVYRVTHGYRRSAADEVDLVDKQYILAFEFCEDGWMLGIVDPGVWLATLKTEAMKLTVGETIGWLPGTHVADTDIDVAKLLHSAVAAASVSIERHASVSHGAHVVDTQTNSDTALQLPVTAFTSRLAATSVSLEQPGMGEHEASDGKTSVPSKAAPNPPTMADFVAAWIASSVAAIARGDEIPEAGDTQTDSHRDLIYDNTDGRAPSSRSCHSPPVMFAESPANSNTGSNFSNASSKSFTRNMAIALYDCRAEVDDELTFKCGDVLVLTKLESGDDWLEGRLHAKPGAATGLVPRSYVREMNEHEFHFIHSLVAPIAPGCRSESAPSVDVEEHVYEDISTCGSRGSYSDVVGENDDSVGNSGNPGSGDLPLPDAVQTARPKPTRPAPPPPQTVLSRAVSSGSEQRKATFTRVPERRDSLYKRRASRQARRHGESNASKVTAMAAKADQQKAAGNDCRRRRSWVPRLSRTSAAAVVVNHAVYDQATNSVDQPAEEATAESEYAIAAGDAPPPAASALTAASRRRFSCGPRLAAPALLSLSCSVTLSEEQDQSDPSLEAVRARTALQPARTPSPLRSSREARRLSLASSDGRRQSRPVSWLSDSNESASAASKAGLSRSASPQQALLSSSVTPDPPGHGAMRLLPGLQGIRPLVVNERGDGGVSRDRSVSPHSPRGTAPLPGRVVEGYTAQREGELSLAGGEMVIVSEYDPAQAWWVGRVDRLREGRFPAACVRLQARPRRGQRNSSSVESTPLASRETTPRVSLNECKFTFEELGSGAGLLQATSPRGRAVTES